MEEGLSPFYYDPNNSIWGKTLSRVLYHESLHFWQFLASGYMANFLNEEWSRILHFENSNEIKPSGEYTQNYDKRRNGEPFSPQELVECWARHWDVHTRNPATVIKEEGIILDMSGPLTGRNGIGSMYTSRAYDSVMEKGKDCEEYGRPYRWMLEKSSHDTRFVAFTFPIIVHHAFGSMEPVLVFRMAFERAWESSKLQELIRQQPGNINLAWINLWNDVVKVAIYPTLAETGMPSYTSGFDVIERGKLSTHPVFKEYLTAAKSPSGELKFRYQNIKLPKNEDEYWENAQITMPFNDVNAAYLPQSNPFHDLSVVFGLPGQPLYRFLLGQYLTPPRVKFENFTYNTRRSALLRLNGVKPEVETYEKDVDSLIERIECFHKAES